MNKSFFFFKWPDELAAAEPESTGAQLLQKDWTARAQISSEVRVKLVLLSQTCAVGQKRSARGCNCATNKSRKKNFSCF